MNLLISKGADINTDDYDFSYTTQYASLRILKKLIEAGLGSFEIQGAMDFSSSCAHYDRLALLLISGANSNGQ